MDEDWPFDIDDDEPLIDPPSMKKHLSSNDKLMEI